MFAVLVRLTLAPGQMSALLPMIHDNAQASLAQEPGCHRFDVLTDPDRPDHVCLYELYASREAFDAHLTMPHFLAFDRASADLVTAKEVTTWREVQP